MAALHRRETTFAPRPLQTAAVRRPAAWRVRLPHNRGAIIAHVARDARLFREYFTRECGLDRARDDDSSLCCSRNASAERPTKSESCRSCAARGLVLRQIMPMVREGVL